jgi:flagellin-like hook-associated protein FlgL
LTSAPLPQAVEEALDEIELRLRQMLALARLSASDSDVDRMVLQKKLERLREEIDRIADEMQQN